MTVPSPLIGIIYAVKDRNGTIIKIGSTAGPLHVRSRNYRKEFWFRDRGCMLIPIRSIEHANGSELFIWHLRAAETLEISRHRTWSEQGGLNKVSPLRQQASTIERLREIARSGGFASGNLAKATGQASRLGKQQGPIQGSKNIETGHIQRLGRSNVRTMHCSLNGKIQGRKAAMRGQIQALGRVTGKRTWEKNGFNTRFKRGQCPHNYLPLGTITIRSDGYSYKKTEDGWAFLGRLK